MRRTFIALALILTACSGPSSQTVLEMHDSGSTLELEVGETFVVNLHGNPTTGFVWLVEDYDETMIVMTDGSYAENPSSRVGAGGEFSFEFEATRAGTTDIELRYRRSWEDLPAERTFTVRVVVG